MVSVQPPCFSSRIACKITIKGTNMNEVKVELADGSIRIKLSGHIDSTNAEDIKAALFESIGDAEGKVTIDASELEYISSAGLRVLLQLRKKHTDISIFEVSPEVYEIFDVTGFTQMMDVYRAYRRVSIEGAEVIGRGANGTLYRIDKDNVVKVYNNADALEDIQHEREVARLALILGIPTAISYDIVRVGDSYGSVFELLNAKSFSKILSNEPDKFDWCVDEYIKMLRRIHDTIVPKGKLPDMKETALDWAHFVQDYLPEDVGTKLISLVEAIPHDDHMMHGDYHTKNLELTEDEVLLIDMDTLAVGDPVFEFASIFNALIGFSEVDHNIIQEFQGYSFEVASKFWDCCIRAYLDTDDEDVICDMADRARIIGYTRMIRRSIRRHGLENETRKAEIDHWTAELVDLVREADHLSYRD